MMSTDPHRDLIARQGPGDRRADQRLSALGLLRATSADFEMAIHRRRDAHGVDVAQVKEPSPIDVAAGSMWQELDDPSPH